LARYLIKYFKIGKSLNPEVLNKHETVECHAKTRCRSTCPICLVNLSQ